MAWPRPRPPSPPLLPAKPPRGVGGWGCPACCSAGIAWRPHGLCLHRGGSWFSAVRRQHRAVSWTNSTAASTTAAEKTRAWRGQMTTLHHLKRARHRAEWSNWCRLADLVRPGEGGHDCTLRPRPSAEPKKLPVHPRSAHAPPRSAVRGPHQSRLYDCPTPPFLAPAVLASEGDCRVSIRKRSSLHRTKKNRPREAPREGVSREGRG